MRGHAYSIIVRVQVHNQGFPRVIMSDLLSLSETMTLNDSMSEFKVRKSYPCSNSSPKLIFFSSLNQGCPSNLSARWDLKKSLRKSRSENIFYMREYFLHERIFSAWTLTKSRFSIVKFFRRKGCQRILNRKENPPYHTVYIMDYMIYVIQKISHPYALW